MNARLVAVMNGNSSDMLSYSQDGILGFNTVKVGKSQMWVRCNMGPQDSSCNRMKWYEHAVGMNGDGNANVMNMKLKPECPKGRQRPKWK